MTIKRITLKKNLVTPHLFALSPCLIALNAESIEAAYIDGVLKIDIAKREEAKMVRRQIEIK